MKGFNFFDRQSRKTLEGLVASHYVFSVSSAAAGGSDVV
jgi:hypothetical protein